MDFHAADRLVLPNFCPLPFYMTYPGYLEKDRERALLQDIKYLQQVYPAQVKRYQKRIAEILDKMDYEGSMIYDEYPDYGGIRRLTDSILQILKNEEEMKPEEEKLSEDRWAGLPDLIQILLCNEIYKRRHGGRRGKIFG